MYLSKMKYNSNLFMINKRQMYKDQRLKIISRCTKIIFFSLINNCKFKKMICAVNNMNLSYNIIFERVRSLKCTYMNMELKYGTHSIQQVVAQKFYNAKQHVSFLYIYFI